MDDDCAWNRCDVCGKFIAISDFDTGAIRRLLTPDSHRSREEWETLCAKHAAADNMNRAFFSLLKSMAQPRGT